MTWSDSSSVRANISLKRPFRAKPPSIIFVENEISYNFLFYSFFAIFTQNEDRIS